MWSNCYSLVSAAESLQCIRISALLLNLEGWDEFRHGSERWVNRILCAHFAIPDSTWASRAMTCLAAIKFQLGNGPQQHQGLLTLAQAWIVSPKGNEWAMTAPGLLWQLWAPLCSLTCILIFSFPWTCGDAEWAAFIYWVPGGIWEWALLRSCWCLVGNLWNTFGLESILCVPHSIFSLSLFFCSRIFMR